MSDSERGIGFQPVESRMLGWKPIPLVFRLILRRAGSFSLSSRRQYFRNFVIASRFASEDTI